jgi:hypothetical protein
VIGDRPLDDALVEFEVRVNSSLVRIEIEDGGAEWNFLGWNYDGCGEEELSLTLVRDLQ